MDSYLDFNAKLYLEEYYNKLDEENLFLLKNFNYVYSNYIHNNDLRAIEVGAGPTIYQFISMSKVVKELVIFDCCWDNIVTSREFLVKKRNLGFWKEYFEAVKDFESSKVAEIVTRVCNVDYEYINADFDFYEFKERFELCSINFFPESISDSEEIFLSRLRKLITLIQVGGFFSIAFLENAKFYKVFERKYKSFPINLEYFKKKLEGEFHILFYDHFDVKDTSRGYSGLGYIWAKKVK